MENKYYTPTIEEFHPGFIYEDGYRVYNNYPDSYVDRFITKVFKATTDLIDLDDIINNRIGRLDNSIRVKYLDREDIESLGWEYAQYLDRTTICLNFERPNSWYLNYWFGETPYVEISRDGYDIGCALHIKNKSELIKIMKQLGINE